jgi:hypothetical protein
MARKEVVTVELFDDMTGKPLNPEDAVNIKVGYKGKTYTLDLSPASATKLDAALAFLKDVAPDGKSGQRGTKTTVPSDAKVIREWARANGVEVAAKGRIHPDVRAAYEAAH